MNELFSPDGHLTPEALKNLVDGGEFSEMQRLEIAEHLSFCDECVACYTQLLDDSLLLSPIQPVLPPVMQRIRERARKIFVNKYATVVAAASIAIVFWNIGVFHVDLPKDRMSKAFLDSSVSFSQKTTELTNGITDALNKIFYRIPNERGTNNEKK